MQSKSYPEPQPTDNPSFGQPTRLRGRVVDREGKVQIANRHLVVDREQLYTQEDANGNLPNLPSTDASPELNTLSTGRIFSLLSLVEECAAIPGQPLDGGILV